jgi:hypothetical protein
MELSFVILHPDFGFMSWFECRRLKVEDRSESDVLTFSALLHMPRLDETAEKRFYI